MCEITSTSIQELYAVANTFSNKLSQTQMCEVTSTSIQELYVVVSTFSNRLYQTQMCEVTSQAYKSCMLWFIPSQTNCLKFHSMRYVAQTYKSCMLWLIPQLTTTSSCQVPRPVKYHGVQGWWSEAYPHVSDTHNHGRELHTMSLSSTISPHTENLVPPTLLDTIAKQRG